MSVAECLQRVSQFWGDRTCVSILRTPRPPHFSGPYVPRWFHHMPVGGGGGGG